MSAQEPIVAVDDGVIVGVAGGMALGRCQPDVAEQVKMFPALAGLGPRTGLRVVRWTAEWSKHDPLSRTCTSVRSASIATSRDRGSGRG